MSTAIIQSSQKRNKGCIRKDNAYEMAKHEHQLNEADCSTANLIAKCRRRKLFVTMSGFHAPYFQQR